MQKRRECHGHSAIGLTPGSLIVRLIMQYSFPRTTRWDDTNVRQDTSVSGDTGSEQLSPGETTGYDDTVTKDEDTVR